MSAYTHNGRVYFVACGSHVKIGYTSSPISNRLVALRNAVRRDDGKMICPDDLDRAAPLKLITTIPKCVMRDEKRLHSLFDAHHVVGEWFRFDEAFQDHLLALRYTTYREGLLHFRHARAELKRRPSLVAAA